MHVVHRQLENTQLGIPELKTITRSRHARKIIIIQVNFVGVSHLFGLDGVWEACQPYPGDWSEVESVGGYECAVNDVEPCQTMENQCIC